MTTSVYHFSPAQHEEHLAAIIRDLLAADTIDRATYEAILRRHPKAEGGFFSKSEIIRGFRHLNSKLEWNLDERPILERLRMKPIRTMSGVAPVTVLTQPFPCPGRCVFCPSDVRMPKSYLSDEPGAQRAAQHRFDPFAQTYSRLTTYHNIGHQTDKVELIILGGTWSSYPEGYQVWFVRRCFDALNRFRPQGPDAQDPDSVRPAIDFAANPTAIDGRTTEHSYNQVVTSFLQGHGSAGSLPEESSWAELEQAQTDNEEAGARCVGLVVETRPDHLDLEEVIRMRRLGTTKVQIGYQSLSDSILEQNRRGHDVAATRRAMAWLREAGFKIHAHWMPNLVGSDPQLDLEDFDRIFSDLDYRPDELKIYPCSLVESAELMAYYEDRRWRPYTDRELLRVVSECMMRTPPWCRLTRVVRDIPGTDIVDGSRVTNLRQVAEQHLRERGLRPQDIRSREIRHRRVDPAELRLDRIDYESRQGVEVFLQFVTAENRIAAFLRLSLPREKVRIAEIDGSAMIREVHVYGVMAGIDQRRGLRSQHLGLGRRLIERAARISALEGYRDLAVISGVGTRAYYRRHGFVDGDLYQHRPLGGIT